MMQQSENAGSAKNFHVSLDKELLEGYNPKMLVMSKNYAS